MYMAPPYVVPSYVVPLYVLEPCMGLCRREVLSPSVITPGISKACDLTAAAPLLFCLS